MGVSEGWSAGSNIFKEGCLKLKRDILLSKIVLKSQELNADSNQISGFQVMGGG